MRDKERGWQLGDLPQDAAAILIRHGWRQRNPGCRRNAWGDRKSLFKILVSRNRLLDDTCMSKPID